MPAILLYGGAFLLYAALAFHFWRTRWRGASVPKISPLERAAIVAPFALHTWLVYDVLWGQPELRFGLGQALSVMLWLSVLIYWAESLYLELAGMEAPIIEPAVHAFDRIPPAPRARHDRLRHVHDRGAACAADDPDGTALARRGGRRAARCAAAALDDGEAAVPDHPRGVHLPHAHARHRARVFRNSFRAGYEVQPQDALRSQLVAYFRRAPRRPSSLRLA